MRFLPSLLAALLVMPGASFAREQDVREAIVKIYTVHSRPDYYNPWSMHGHQQSTGSGCIIEGNKILTNAHVVSDETFIQVRRYSESRKYEARVLEVSHQADLAILTVDDPSFFEGIEPLEFGELPGTQDEVLVYGFPLGGDTMSITKGVISRIEHQHYAHSSVYLLAGQIDAAINPGNSGGPVIKDGAIVGVVMQAIRRAENIGYMVPISIVNHFIADIRDGTRDGFPSLGVVLQDMENDDLKRKYEMPGDREGVLIIRTLVGSPAAEQLQVGDVLLSVDGNDVAEDGTVEFRPKERTSVSYFIQEKQVGESVKIEILRGGEILPVDFTLSRPVEEDWLIPMERYDVLPSYYIYGGIVFTPLTKNLLRAWGGSWHKNAPKPWVAKLGLNFVEEEMDEIVVALKVLAADVNEGYHKFSNHTITKVNGRKIRNLEHLVELVEAPSEDRFIVFSNDEEQQIVLDRQKVEAANGRILDTYRVQADRSDDLKI